MSEESPASLPQFKKSSGQETVFSIFLKTALLFSAIAAVAVFVSWSFGWIAVETPSRAELFQKSIEGRADTRRAATLEWSRRLVSAEERGADAELGELRPSAEETRRLASSLVLAEGLWDPSGLAGLQTVLSFSVATSIAAEVLCGWLSRQEPEHLPEAQIYSVLGLGRLAQVQAEALCEPLFARALGSEPALQKSVAFALGLAAANPDSAGRRDEIVSLLQRLYAQGSEDVRWNAAFAGARWDAGFGRDAIEKLVNEAGGVGEDGGRVLDELRLGAYREAFRAALRLGDPDLRSRIETIAESSSSIRLRQVARSELDSKRAIETGKK